MEDVHLVVCEENEFGCREYYSPHVFKYGLTPRNALRRKRFFPRKEQRISFLVFRAQKRNRYTGARGFFSREIVKTFQMEFILQKEDIFVVKLKIIARSASFFIFNSKKLEGGNLIHSCRKKVVSKNKYPEIYREIVRQTGRGCTKKSEIT